MTTTSDKKTAPHKYTGEEVGLAFLWEFTRVYQGHIKDIIPDQERTEMVAALDNDEDMTAYVKYREIYWNFLVKTSEHESARSEARYWYLKLKAAIADGDQLKIDETDDFLNNSWTWYFSQAKSASLRETPKTNHEKIEKILAKYERCLYVCKCIEIGTEIITHALGIGDSPFNGIGVEQAGAYFKEVNKLLREHKELRLKPIRKKDIKPPQDVLDNARVYARSIKDKPEDFDFVFHNMFKI